MVQIRDGSIYIKLVYWGMFASGKTTILDTLYNLSKEKKKDIVPKENLTKIESSSGSTLYFDKGIFQSKKQKKVYYIVYTVAGQKSYSKLRKRVYEGVDGVIFVADSQRKYFDENIEYLKELKSVAQQKLIVEIPLVIMLNKQDLTNVISKEEFRQVLEREKLWYEEESPLSTWNPKIFYTCALPSKSRNIYKSFYECSRRTVLYQIYGDGKAPDKSKTANSLLMELIGD
ncbi:MAG: hypothetical protein EU541_04825 [Promethearchaeota archaeon]|nr:MAG: hypothetical protein EU541_04825 [Candidatus Lokiarchaeota archaeon]